MVEIAGTAAPRGYYGWPKQPISNRVQEEDARLMRLMRENGSRPANGEVFRPKQVSQHPGARERMLQVQLVDPPHQLQFGIAYRRGR